MLVNQRNHARTVFATRQDGVMTVAVNEFHGIYFEEYDGSDMYDDLPALIAVSDDDECGSVTEIMNNE